MVAQDVHEGLDLDLTLFVPARHPPHRPEGAVLAADRRAELVAAAIAEDERFALWTGELRRAGPSYTVDTLESLRDEHPRADLYLLLGADQFLTLAGWHRPDRIAELATLVVAGRGPDDSGASVRGGRYPGRAVETRQVDVSSTEIRERIRAGRTVRYLVTDPVRRIIEENRWYKTG